MTRTGAMIIGTALGLLASGAARADVTISRGNIPGATDNVLYNNCSGSVQGPAATIQGCLNQARATLVDLATTGDSLKIQGGGQANLEAVDGSFNDLTIAFADGAAFNYLILNIDVPKKSSGIATFTASLGGQPAVSQTLALNGNGQNFFTVQATGGDALTSFRIVSDAGMSNVNQVRIAAAPIPEPGEWALMLAGLGVVGWIARGRQARKAQA